MDRSGPVADDARLIRIPHVNYTREPWASDLMRKTFARHIDRGLSFWSISAVMGIDVPRLYGYWLHLRKIGYPLIRRERDEPSGVEIDLAIMWCILEHGRLNSRVIQEAFAKRGAELSVGDLTGRATRLRANGATFPDGRPLSGMDGTEATKAVFRWRRIVRARRAMRLRETALSP